MMGTENTEYEKVLPDLVRISVETGEPFEFIRERYFGYLGSGLSSADAVDASRWEAQLEPLESKSSDALDAAAKKFSNSSAIPKVPTLIFVPLEEHTEDDLRAELEKHACENPTRLVWMRYKYRWEDKWHYTIEACGTDLEERIFWLTDWWKGQEDVEYLAVSWYDPLY